VLTKTAEGQFVSARRLCWMVVMARLSYLEKRTLETLFQMGAGYVLNFSDRTFAEFMADSVGLDASLPKYAKNGSSKANRLRTIFELQPDHVVGRLVSELIALEDQQCQYADVDDRARDQAVTIASRLLQGGSIEDADALTPNTPEHTFEVLAKELKDAIEKDTPEVSLDRLHTFAIKFIRAVYERHFGRPANRDSTANVLLGEYANDLKAKGVIDSKMTAEILKSTGRVLDTFNSVRNNQTLAHDNPALLNRSEARLIYANVAGSIRFIRALEQQIVDQKKV
jgi:hypothetical protein